MEYKDTIKCYPIRHIVKVCVTQKMNTLGTRIRQKRLELNLTQDDIGKIFEPRLQRSAISKWERDAAVPELSRLPLIAKKLKTSVDYLITGKESKIKKGSDIIEIDIADEETQDKFVWIDIIESSFSCGIGESIEFHYDTVIGKMPFPHSFFQEKNVSPKNMKIVTAKGDSMNDLIKDGDLVGIDISQTQVRDGGIYAVYFAGEGMIKQIFKEQDNSLILHSTNPKFKDRTVTEENGTNFKVMGRQFWRAG